ncbi:MAG: rod shape-determining protein RodA [Anaerolineales bacterium]|nr:rod shape-determining protein RodA [Anaerolineales bacterium]MCW5854868.1 rod shape-determining protein RodA [Anaerolineales bacterium]
MRTAVWRHFDFWLLGAVAVLITFGLAMISSAIAGNPELIELDVLGRQITFAAIGFVVILVSASFDYRLWISISRVLYAFLFILLLFVVVAGESSFGAQRWLNIGLVVLQPSELAKITMIIILADFFARNRDAAKDFKWIFRSAISTVALVALILAQPNLSTSIVLMTVWFSLLWVSGLEVKHLLMFIFGALLIAVVSFPLLEDYQRQRIINFVAPDPEAALDANYNVTQALITIGSGGVLGQGYGQSTQVQLRFLKVRHNDFIFSAIAAEFGLVGAMAVLGVLFFIVWRCVRIAQLSQDTFGSLIAYGVAVIIALHTIVNVGMNIQVLPVTGLPLPFISAGGSSLLTFMFGIGLVESVVARHRALNFS